MKIYEATEQAYKNGYAKGYADSTERWSKLTNAEMKWIPVSEPPKEKGCYLVNANHWWDGKPVAREAFWNGDDWLSCYDKFKISQRVTHWMPLPEPPKGE